jgi:two-component system chemotaxis response regulator CheB
MGSEVSGAPIRVMVVDDSAIIRGLVSQLLEREPDICVVTSASNGRMAVDRLRSQAIDVIVLDIDMAVMDGLTALPHLRAAAPSVRIIIASTLSKSGAEVTLRALRLGAADYVAKPTANRALTSGAHDGEAFRRELVAKVRCLGRSADVAGHAADRPVAGGGAAMTWALRPPGRSRPDVVVVGSSTGGPQALFELFAHLPTGFPLPILIAQHMPPRFTAILAEHIARSTGRICREAVDGDEPVAGHVYVAPGDVHMVIDLRDGRRLIGLDHGPMENYCRPAVDPLFRSAAKAHGERVLGIVLTGMGSDGLKGGEAIVAAGGTLIAQDAGSSIVWGMPGAVARAGLCAAVEPVPGLATFMVTQAAERL